MADETPAPLSDAEMPDYHKTVPVQVWADIDIGIAEVVRHLNTMEGVRTHTSCEGTPCLIYPNGMACYVMVSWEDEAALVRIQADYTTQIPPNSSNWGYVLPNGGSIETDNEGQPQQDTDAARADIPRLLATLAAQDAELAALREREAAEREIVAAVAAMRTNDMRRAVVGAPALITRARALLAAQTPGTTGATAREE